MYSAKRLLAFAFFFAWAQLAQDNPQLAGFIQDRLQTSDDTLFVSLKKNATDFTYPFGVCPVGHDDFHPRCGWQPNIPD